VSVHIRGVEALMAQVRGLGPGPKRVFPLLPFYFFYDKDEIKVFAFKSRAKRAYKNIFNSRYDPDSFRRRY